MLWVYGRYKYFNSDDRLYKDGPRAERDKGKYTCIHYFF